MEIRSAAKLGPRVRIKFPEEGLTKQSMAAECDINNIVAKYQKTGAIAHYSKHEASYGFADSLTLHEALNVVKKADSMFLDLPSSIRTRFEGDPGLFLDFVQDSENSEEMVELGLATPKAVAEAPRAPEPPAEGDPAEAPEAPVEPA